MKPLPRITTRLSQLLRAMLYRLLGTRIVPQPVHRAGQIASGIAAGGNPQGV